MCRLEKENLVFRGHIRIKHLLDVLYNDIGADVIKTEIKKEMSGLPLAVQFGCHALRPADVVAFDNADAPFAFDRLVELTGAKSVDWSKKTDCCGAPLGGVNDELSHELTRQKLNNARQSGAQYICTACSFCQMQFDTVRRSLSTQQTENDVPAPLLYTQLLGLAMGLNEYDLGATPNGLGLA